MQAATADLPRRAQPLRLRKAQLPALPDKPAVASDQSLNSLEERELGTPSALLRLLAP